MQQVLSSTLRRAELLYGDRLGVIDQGVRHTYAEVARRCRKLAGALKQSGVGRGDRIATLMLNGHRYLECYFGVPGSGGVLVPLNNRLAVPELRYILEDSDVHTLVVDEAHAPVGAELAASVKQVIDGSAEYEDWLTAAGEVELGVGVDENDLAALLYTGGTTGAAKGVMMSHRNLLSNAQNITIAIGYTDEHTYLHVAPMFHAADGASTYAVTWVGGTHVTVPGFDPQLVLDTIANERVTHVTMVPAMLTALINTPGAREADLSSLVRMLHGAAPIAMALLRESIEVFGCSFLQGYGMTEAAAIVTALPNEESIVDDPRLASAGREVLGVEVTVRREDGSECEPGEIGEVVARGPNFTLGYWKKPVETANALRDGWYWTGDLGYLDDERYLFLVDRAKDMIISGGENVYSIEVEDALARHPAVMQSAVIGVPDEKWGERVHAVVVLKPGAEAIDAELIEHCRTLIAGFKCPRSIEFADALPMSGAGKILKRDLREKHWAGSERRIN